MESSVPLVKKGFYGKLKSRILNVILKPKIISRIGANFRGNWDNLGNVIFNKKITLHQGRAYSVVFTPCSTLGAIHKPRGQIFDPPLPSWSLLLNKAYVKIWSFG